MVRFQRFVLTNFLLPCPSALIYLVVWCLPTFAFATLRRTLPALEGCKGAPFPSTLPLRLSRVSVSHSPVPFLALFFFLAEYLLFTPLFPLKIHLILILKLINTYFETLGLMKRIKNCLSVIVPILCIAVSCLTLLSSSVSHCAPIFCLIESFPHGC